LKLYMLRHSSGPVDGFTLTCDSAEVGEAASIEQPGRVLPDDQDVVQDIVCEVAPPSESPQRQHAQGAKKGKLDESSVEAPGHAGRACAAMTSSDLHALLRTGPVVEDEQRAAKNRTEKSAKGDRARVAHETIEIIRNMGYDSHGRGRIELKSKLLDAIAASRFYLAETASQQPWRKRFGGGTDIEVSCCTVLSAAECLRSMRNAFPPGVLNFASARNPGGGFCTGAEAQEESIARSSAIYPCLAKHFKAFFVPHRLAASGAYTHAMIYSPGVPVFRDSQGNLLDEPYDADFVTAAAPNRGVMERSAGAEQEAEAALQERADRVLQVFAEHSTADLVLGAWGCGVFKNDPKTVATIFKKLLEGRFKGAFRRVIFAVLDPRMAEDFAKVFGIKLANATAPAKGKHTDKAGDDDDQDEDKQKQNPKKGKKGKR